jgi:hypothetical protein
MDPKNIFLYGHQCIQDGCPYYAIYLGDDRPSYCDAHYPDPDAKVKKIFKDYKHRVCIEKDCHKRASFNYENGMRQIFCQNHKQPNMINVASIKCVECKKETAKFCYKKNYPKATLCRACRDKKDNRDDIVDCYETLCDPPNCWTQASFGYNRKDKKDWRCKAHKKADMIDVKNIHRMCQFAGGCEHQANYNFPTEKKAIFCKTHKDIGMVDMHHKTCGVAECRLRPQYNFEGEKQGRFCLKHKEHNMVDVESKQCSEKKCTKVALYNFPEFSYPVVCPDHITQGMVDVRRILCELDGCYTQASYGFLGKIVSRCATHKLNGMLRQPNRRCRHTECNEYALYGYKTTYPMYCELHKRQDHINLVEQKCGRCGLYYILNLDGMCMYCEAKEEKHIIMKKQHVIKMWLISNNYNFIIYDKPIDKGACVRNRPDFVFESTNGGVMVVLEVDENMHKGDSYTPECEIIRMINLSQALGQPTIFIRFNPDNYKRDGKTIINDDPKYRHSVLKKWLDDCIGIAIEKVYNIGFCSMIKLFYNEFNENEVQFETLLPFDAK